MKTAPALPVAEALQPLLPNGIRRGSTVAVEGSLSLLFALLGAASASGAWCALVGFPRVSAESLAEYGVALERCALVPLKTQPKNVGTEWTTAVGALLDAVDLVAVRPPGGASRIAPGEVRRLAGRARSKDSVLVPYGAWQGPDVRLKATTEKWDGITATGGGRLKSRQVTVSAEGRGAYARPRRTTLWLPSPAGGITPANVVELAG